MSDTELVAKFFLDMREFAYNFWTCTTELLIASTRANAILGSRHVRCYCSEFDKHKLFDHIWIYTTWLE